MSLYKIDGKFYQNNYIYYKLVNMPRPVLSLDWYLIRPAIHRLRDPHGSTTKEISASIKSVDRATIPLRKLKVTLQRLIKANLVKRGTNGFKLTSY